MRGAKTVGGSALLVALLLGAPGCATAGPVDEAPITCVATVPGLEPAASVTASAWGGLSETFGQSMSMPSGGEMLALGALIVLVSPFLLVYAVVGTPVRVLARLRR